MSDIKGTSSQGRGEIPSTGQYDFSHLRDAHPTTAAFAYVEKDWTLVPVDVQTGKVDLAEGIGGASRDVETVLDWADEPGKAIGIATGRRSGVVALRWKGELGQRVIQVLEAQDVVVATLEAASGDGSEFLVFRAPAEAIDSREQIAPGLDFLGEGDFFVPCHSSWGTDNTDLAKLPDLLHSIITGRSTFGAKEMAVAGVFEALNDATPYEAALAYAALRWKLLKIEEQAEPIPPRGKTRKPETWKEDPAIGLGIVTGAESRIVGIMAASRGHLEKFEGQHGQLPFPRFSCSGSFEFHCFRAPREPFPSQLLSPGIKYVGENDFLPMPPTVIANGKLRWKAGKQLQQDLPELPPWLYDRVAQNQHEVEGDRGSRPRPARQKAARGREQGPNLRAFALRYAAKGLPVFPLKPNTVEPMFLKRGSGDATTDPETISRWWSKTPLANIGIRTGGASGVAVLVADAQSGLRSLADLEMQRGTIQTPRAEDPSGRLFLLFDCPESGVESCAGFLPGLDFLGDGSFAVLPPSRLGGQECRWVDQAQKGKAKVPDWLLDIVAEQAQKAKASSSSSTAPSVDHAERWAKLLKEWLAERCETGEGFSAQATALLDDFCAWSGKTVTPQFFGRLLRESGVERKKSSVYWYLGLRLK